MDDKTLNQMIYMVGDYFQKPAIQHFPDEKKCNIKPDPEKNDFYIIKFEHKIRDGYDSIYDTLLTPNTIFKYTRVEALSMINMVLPDNIVCWVFSVDNKPLCKFTDYKSFIPNLFTLVNKYIQFRYEDVTRSDPKWVHNVKYVHTDIHIIQYINTEDDDEVPIYSKVYNYKVISDAAKFIILIPAGVVGYLYYGDKCEVFYSHRTFLDMFQKYVGLDVYVKYQDFFGDEIRVEYLKI